MIWEGYGASVVGTSHQTTGVPCQDAFLLRLCGPVVIAAVADGLGSAAKSDTVSKLAVAAAGEAVEQALATTTPLTEFQWHEVLRSSFDAARFALEQHSAVASQPLRDLATTLLVAYRGLPRLPVLPSSPTDCRTSALPARPVSRLSHSSPHSSILSSHRSTGMDWLVSSTGFSVRNGYANGRMTTRPGNI